MFTTLTQDVVVEGRSIWPFFKKSAITISPGNGDYFMQKRSLRASRGWRCLYLVGMARTLWVPEHMLGALFLYGLHDVDINIPKGRGIPYVNSGKNFHEAFLGKTQIVDSGGYVTTTKEVRIECDGKRKLVFKPAKPGQKSLIFNVTVDYEGYDKVTVEVDTANLDLTSILTARSLGNGVWRTLLAIVTRASDDFVWLSKRDSDKIRQAKLEELARHRILDLCGALYMTILPPSTSLVGIIETALAGHVEDVALTEEMKSVGLVGV